MKTHTLFALTLVSLAVAGSSADGGKKAKWKLKKTPALAKACDGGDQVACTQLAEYRWYGIFGSTVDTAGAETLAKTACEAGVGRACGKYGEYVRYNSSDHAAAMVAFEKGCELGDGSACWHRLDVNDNGQGQYLEYADKQKWIEKSWAAYSASCAAGDQIQCSEMAEGMISSSNLDFSEWFPNDMAKAAKLFDKACGAGWPEACRQLAAAYEGGWGVAQSDRKAKKFYTKACKASSQDACDNLAALIADRRARGIKI